MKRWIAIEVDSQEANNKIFKPIIESIEDENSGFVQTVTGDTKELLIKHLDYA